MNMLSSVALQGQSMCKVALIFFPWLETSGCKPIAEPVSFLNCPFAFVWINNESILPQSSQDCGKELDVVIPILGECTNIINVYVCIFDARQYTFHDGLCYVCPPLHQSLWSPGHLGAAREGSNQTIPFCLL